MKTKDRILEVAIQLFNKYGINKVSIRDIGEKLGMSSGNFAYHFKNKEVLLEYFYNQMYDEVEIQTVLEEQEGFLEFQNILNEITAFMTKYSFFYTDIVDIFRSCPAIKNSYAENYEGRKDIYKGFINHFIKNSLLEISQNKEQIIDELTHTIWFTLTFWQSQKLILSSGSNMTQAQFVITQIWRILIPYMTDVGLAQYQKIK